MDVRKLGPAYQNEVGYLPEVPPLHPELTVRESMEYVCGLRGIRSGKRKAHIEQLCELAGVADRMSMTTRSLSKGYKQRAGLAQALIGNPELIILDEPTAGLDPEQIVSIRELIRELGRDHAVILSSHILSEIEDVCSTLLILRKGELVASGTIAEIANGVRTDAHRLRVRVSGENAEQLLGGYAERDKRGAASRTGAGLAGAGGVLAGGYCPAGAGGAGGGAGEAADALSHGCGAGRPVYEADAGGLNMLSVIRKEWRSYFATPIGYVFIAIFWLLGRCVFLSV